MLADEMTVLRSSFLFESATDSELECALMSINPYTLEYEKGEFICTPEHFEQRLGFIVHGECEVLHKHESRSDVKIKTLRRSDTFGIIGVFSSSTEYPTTIIASKKCRVLYIDKPDVYFLIENHPFIALSVVEFLASRMQFMNSKVATFSASSVEQKMAQFIINESRLQNSALIKLNKSSVASEIGVGRASLYRTLTSFSELGLIKIDNKYVQIIDLKGLERIKK